jgi:hypothetical protein
VVGAFEVIAEDRQRGTIVLQDTRANGAVVVLICREAGGAPPPGAVMHPAPPDPVYPLELRARIDRTLREGADADAPEAFRLEVNLETMPAGRLDFELPSFIRAAAEVASTGVDSLDLTEEIAADWGYTGRGLATA